MNWFHCINRRLQGLTKLGVSPVIRLHSAAGRSVVDE